MSTFIKCFLRGERIRDEVFLCFVEDNDRVMFLSSVVWGVFMEVVYVNLHTCCKIAEVFKSFTTPSPQARDVLVLYTRDCSPFPSLCEIYARVMAFQIAE